MNELQRYRLNMLEFIDRKGWKKLVKTGQFHIEKQEHKKGGWVRFDAVKNLETKLKASEAECERLSIYRGEFNRLKNILASQEGYTLQMFDTVIDEHLVELRGKK